MTDRLTAALTLGTRTALPHFEIPSHTLPLVAVAGSRGKTTVGWMLEHMLRVSGREVGAWLSSGVYAGGVAQEGELGPWARVVRDAQAGRLDVAVQEMNAATVVAAGLPAAMYPLTLITTLCGNNDACLVAPETQAERRAIETVLAATRDDGIVVANADDFTVVELAHAHPGTSALFALHHDNPALQRHLASGGLGAWVDDGLLVFGTSRQIVPLLPVNAIPSTLDGAIIFQIQNALAATLGGVALGLEPARIAEALESFVPDPAVQPGACNIVPYNGGTIVVDTPSRIWSLRMLARGIKHQRRRRTMVVTGSFPAMRYEDLNEAGRVVGSLGGIVALHGSDVDRERLEALKEGMAAAPVPPLVLSLADEMNAIDHLLNALGPDDVGLVLATDPSRALAHLWPAPAISIGRQRRPLPLGKIDA